MLTAITDAIALHALPFKSNFLLYSSQTKLIHIK